MHRYNCAQIVLPYFALTYIEHVRRSYTVHNVCIFLKTPAEPRPIQLINYGKSKKVTAFQLVSIKSPRF